LQHHHCNKHHWQYWVFPIQNKLNNNVIDIPEEYVIEMICDWISAEIIQNRQNEKYINNIYIHNIR
jgi:hypothetical protein